MDILVLSNCSDKENIQRNSGKYEISSKLVQRDKYKYIVEAIENFSEITDIYWDFIIPEYSLIRFKNISKNDLNQNNANITENKKLESVRDININERLKDFSLVFILLKDSYISKFSEKLGDIPEGTLALAFMSIENKEYIGDCFWIPITEKEKEDFGVEWDKLKERQILELSNIISREKDIEEIYRSPQKIYDFISEGCGGCGAGLAKI